MRRDATTREASSTGAAPRWSPLAHALVALGLMFCCAPAIAQAQSKHVLRLKTPDTAIRLVGAHCQWTCRLSALFAPAVLRDNVTGLAVTNTSTVAIRVSAKFIPTNGLALSRNNDFVALQEASSMANLLAKNASPVALAPGDTAQLRLVLDAQRLRAGLYAGQVQFEVKADEAKLPPAAANADPKALVPDPIVQAVVVEARVRDSAVWALLTVVLGILLGRVAQLVYDPKMTARVQLLDWLDVLEGRIARLPADRQNALKAKLDNIRVRLFSRGVDPGSLQAEVATLETEVNAAFTPAPPTVPAEIVAAEEMGTRRLRAKTRAWLATIGGWIGASLRVLAGVSPLSVRSVHDWLLPAFVVLTLVALMVTFMVQQYGGAGTAETFGAGGIADYAALFLAGVASDAIAGGLRAVKLSPR